MIRLISIIVFIGFTFIPHINATKKKDLTQKLRQTGVRNNQEEHGSDSEYEIIDDEVKKDSYSKTKFQELDSINKEYEDESNINQNTFTKLEKKAQLIGLSVLCLVTAFSVLYYKLTN